MRKCGGEFGNGEGKMKLPWIFRKPEPKPLYEVIGELHREDIVGKHIRTVYKKPIRFKDDPAPEISCYDYLVELEDGTFVIILFGIDEEHPEIPRIRADMEQLDNPRDFPTNLENFPYYWPCFGQEITEVVVNSDDGFLHSMNLLLANRKVLWHDFAWVSYELYLEDLDDEMKWLTFWDKKLIEISSSDKTE